MNPHPVSRTLLLEAPAPLRRFSSDAIHRVEACCARHFPFFTTRIDRRHRYHETGDLLVVGVHSAQPEPVALLAVELLGVTGIPLLFVETGHRVTELDGSMPVEAVAETLRRASERPV